MLNNGKYIPVREKIINRLYELDDKEILTEGERYEEQILSRQFLEWGRVEYSLKVPRVTPFVGIDFFSMTKIERRIMLAVARNDSVPDNDFIMSL